MRIHAAFLAAVFALGVSPGALALDATVPPANAPSTRETTADTAPPAVPRVKTLNELFIALKGDDADAADRAESDILALWLESGSETVDLLMRWALQAIDSKAYPLALDYLDRITTLKPEYVEGWNKRATVYYLTDDYGKALSDIEHVLALEPRHFGALAGLGTIFRDLDQDRRALTAYRAALAIDPRMDNVQKAIDELEAKGIEGKAI